MDYRASIVLLLAVAACSWTISNSLPIETKPNSWPNVRFQRIYFPDNLPAGVVSASASQKKPMNSLLLPDHREPWQPITFPTVKSDKRPKTTQVHFQPPSGPSPSIIFNDDEESPTAHVYSVPYSWLEKWLKANMHDIEQIQGNIEDHLFPKDYKSLRTYFDDFADEQTTNTI